MIVDDRQQPHRPGQGAHHQRHRRASERRSATGRDRRCTSRAQKLKYCCQQRHVERRTGRSAPRASPAIASGAEFDRAVMRAQRPDSTGLIGDRCVTRNVDGHADRR